MSKMQNLVVTGSYVSFFFLCKYMYDGKFR